MLAVLPPKALLLSHTDLDWNSVRYLRTCEGARRVPKFHDQIWNFGDTIKKFSCETVSFKVSIINV